MMAIYHRFNIKATFKMRILRFFLQKTLFCGCNIAILEQYYPANMNFSDKGRYCMFKENTAERKLFIASSHGFCNGVRRALECVEELLKSPSGKQPVYIYNEIVHNSFIVNDLKSRGVGFVHSLDEIPDNSVVVWSAHGVPPQLEAAAAARGLQTVDATCPLVKKVHNSAQAHSQAGDAVIFIGHAKHPETVGVLGCGDIYCVGSVEDCAALPDFEPSRKIVILTQTTWYSEDIARIIEVLKKRYGSLEMASGICYATTERQKAVRDLLETDGIQALIVIGSPNSSNSNRLCDVARSHNAEAFLVDDPQELCSMDLEKFSRIGITAGASAPENLLKQAVEILTSTHNYTLVRK